MGSFIALCILLFIAYKIGSFLFGSGSSSSSTYSSSSGSSAGSQAAYQKGYFFGLADRRAGKDDMSGFGSAWRNSGFSDDYLSDFQEGYEDGNSGSNRNTSYSR